MNEKLRASRELIVKALNLWSKPCVLWSGGKDSMVLLHLLRSMLGKIPVVCWREPWFHYKNKFVNRIIDEWELEVWDWHPARVALTKGNNRIDILNYYSFGQHPEAVMMLSRGTEREPAAGEKLVCGKDTVLSRPATPFIPPWDLSFHGHKSTDIDLIHGNLPLEVDLMDTPGMMACAFPLRHWTDADVFDYLEENDVPIDLSRYYKTSEGWQIQPYQRLNPDYLPLCLKCCDPDEGEYVHCFKLKMTINNISAAVRWEKPQLAYCNLGGKE
jgi:hypothetical protein